MTPEALQLQIQSIRETCSRDDLAAVTQLEDLANKLWRDHRHSLAALVFLEILALNERIYGEESPLLAKTLRRLAAYEGLKGEYRKCEQYLSRSLRCLESGGDGFAIELGETLNQFGEACFEQGKHDTAARLCERALAVLGSDIRSDNPQMTRTRNNLGAIHVVRGEYALAERLFRQNLRLAQQRAISGDMSIVTHLNNLAEVNRLRGNFAEAEKLTISSLKESRRLVGESHALTALGLANVAIYRLQAGAFYTAEAALLKSLEIRRVLHPLPHPNLIRSLRSLAEVYVLQQKFVDAERLLDETVAMSEQVYGPTDPQTALSLAQLAALYTETGRAGNADRLLARAEGILSTIDAGDPRHIFTLTARAAFHRSRRNSLEALACLQRTLQIQEKVSGENHLDTARIMLLVGDALREVGELDQAMQILLKALSIREQNFGSDHFLVAEVKCLLARTAIATHEITKASEYCSQCLATYSAMSEKPSTVFAQAISVAAEIAAAQGRLADATMLSLRELEGREKTLGPKHVSLLSPLGRLAGVSRQANDWTSANTYLTRSLGICEWAFGTTDSQTLKIVEELAEVAIQASSEEARRWIDRTIKTLEKVHGPQAEEIALRLDRFGALYRKMGCADLANEMDDRALSIRDRGSHVLCELL